MGLEPVLGVFGRDLKNAATVGIESMTSRSLGGHHIHYATATFIHGEAESHKKISNGKLVRECILEIHNTSNNPVRI
ncbi:hypothetical protein DPMN_124346 [Dreissena polymorpha]|uniref:Uncharacterized protein n=1 Tax=Dreissena polymorpha TaxID=45954 RepID=A0A9D4JW54_DREPO|nr:hypothetical protein DPMN_124346 [Dreissena polymorpha]